MIDYFRAVVLVISINGALFAAVTNVFVATKQVDLIELNHFHDPQGQHVYSQVIFYEWEPEFESHVVRAWKLIDEKHLPLDAISHSYRHSVTRFDRDQNLHRRITAKHFRESWTQFDPERANKRIVEDRDRVALVDRKITQPQKPVINLAIEPIPDPFADAVVEAGRQ